jgi:hypothetical protein
MSDIPETYQTKINDIIDTYSTNDTLEQYSIYINRVERFCKFVENNLPAYDIQSKEDGSIVCVWDNKEISFPEDGLIIYKETVNGNVEDSLFPFSTDCIDTIKTLVS